MTLSTEWAYTIVNTLVSQGVTDFFIGSGSQSTILTLCIARHPATRIRSFYDERTLSFLALGVAKSSTNAVGIVTTSGSAVANLLPAFVEASQSRYCLVAITADRPPEKHGVGSNQTMPQIGIFSHYVTATCALGCPSAATLPTVSQRIHQLIQTGQQNRQPVHINAMFRNLEFDSLVSPDTNVQSAQLDPVVKLPDQSLDQYPDNWPDNFSMVFVGQLRSVADALAIKAYLDTLTCPIQADITSMLRPYFPEPEFISATITGPVLHIGGALSNWSSLARFKSVSQATHYHVAYDDQPFNPYNATQTVVSVRSFSPTVFSRGLSKTINKMTRQPDSIAQPALSDDAVLRGIQQAMRYAMRAGCALFCGNSLPIRYMDQACPIFTDHITPVFANRGTSGIDGQVATIAGIALGLKQPVLGILGDLTTLYDCNALGLIARSQYPITVLILNNHGGRIFDRLPHLASIPDRDDLFTLPQSVDFAALCHGFGCYHIKINAADFAAYSLDYTRTQVVEVVI